MKTVVQSRDYTEVDGEAVAGWKITHEDGAATMKVGALIIRERLEK